MSDSDGQDKKSKISFGRASVQTASGQSSKGGGAASAQDAGTPACQLTNRKARSSKPLLDLSGQSVATSQPPQRGLSSDDTEYNSLIGAMDNDLDRPEPPSRDPNQQEAPSTQLLPSKGALRLPVCLSVRTTTSQQGCLGALLLLLLLRCSAGVQREAEGQRQSPEEEGGEGEKDGSKDSGRRA